MTVEEVYDLITANKNHKKYNLEKDSDKFTLTLGNFRLLVNKQIADNIESEIPYTYLNTNRQDRVAKVHDLEKDINVLLSRDWEPQTYCRGFHVFIGEPEENGDYDVNKSLFLRFDNYDIIEDVYIEAFAYEVTASGADDDVVYMSTICSMPKVTLDQINNINAKSAIISYASTYSDKYTDWYGKGFSKGTFDK